jgi:hypothetical protein
MFLMTIGNRIISVYYVYIVNYYFVYIVNYCFVYIVNYCFVYSELLFCLYRKLLFCLYRELLFLSVKINYYCLFIDFLSVNNHHLSLSNNQGVNVAMMI